MRTHRISDIAVTLVLLRHECEIQHDPSNHPCSQLAEGFDVNLADERDRDARVQFTANEPIVDDASTVATGSELSLLLVMRLDSEGLDVNECCKRIGNNETAGQKLDVVAIDERPDLELGTKNPGTCGADDHDGESGEEG